MNISSRTPEGLPGRCPLCGQDVVVDPSVPPGDATCPHCGSLLWISGGLEAQETWIRHILAGLNGPYIKEFAAILAVADDLVPRKAVVPELEAWNKAEAIRVLVKSLISAEEISRSDEDDVVAAVLRREELGSTGIGRGFAIPHAENAAAVRPVAAIGRSPKGIDFESVDGEPVHLIVLLVSPPDKPGDHLRALERISSALRSLAP